nr:MAG TPA: hypothetical protein [Caudoviricetes sp.]
MRTDSITFDFFTKRLKSRYVFILKVRNHGKQQFSVNKAE